jgi:hypothetical protein
MRKTERIVDEDGAMRISPSCVFPSLTGFVTSPTMFSGSAMDVVNIQSTHPRLVDNSSIEVIPKPTDKVTILWKRLTLATSILIRRPRDRNEHRRGPLEKTERTSRARLPACFRTHLTLTIGHSTSEARFIERRIESAHGGPASPMDGRWRVTSRFCAPRLVGRLRRLKSGSSPHVIA